MTRNEMAWKETAKGGESGAGRGKERALKGSRRWKSAKKCDENARRGVCG